MKKLIVLCLCLLLLSGCAEMANNITSTLPQVTGPSTTQTQSIRPATVPTVPTTVPLPPTTVPTEPATQPPEPADDALVYIRDYIPDLFVDLKYATTDNFTGKVIYDFTEPQLRYGTVKKLMQVQQQLQALGYSLLIWDAYRPVSAQFALWEACPDPNYVANPNVGYSKHNRGNAVDVTIVLADGTPVNMPTGFDDFSAAADRDYSDASAEARANAMLLEQIMTDCGLVGYYYEWWHYADSVSYDVPLP